MSRLVASRPFLSISGVIHHVIWRAWRHFVENQLSTPFIFSHVTWLCWSRAKTEDTTKRNVNENLLHDLLHI